VTAWGFGAGFSNEESPKGLRKRFFLKKEAKTFVHWRTRCSNAHPNKQKFFGSFFQKRTASLPT
jgi:hypothetical protein